MSDDANAASNAASEPVLSGSGGAAEPVPAQTTPEPAQQAQASEDDKPSKTTREALERAIAKVNTPVDATPDKPAGDKPRDAGGKFAPKDKATQVAADPNKTAPENQIDPAKQAVSIAPPSRFAKQAQTDWANAPESVKTEVRRLETELTQGLEQYREAAQSFEPIKKYHDLAKQHGVTLEAAVGNYVALDHLWATNPIQGFLETCKKTRVDPMQLIQAVVNGGQIPAQQADPRDGVIQKLLQKMDALEGGVTAVKQTVEQQQQQAAYNSTLNEIQAFAKDNPYTEELFDTMTKLATTGFVEKDLKVLYQTALRLNPEIAEKIEADKAARQPKQPGSNPKAALSITGTPQGGSNPTTKPAGSAREALQRAFAQVGA